MDPISLWFTAALISGAISFGKKIGDVVVDAYLEPFKEQVEKRVQKDYREAEKKDKLWKAIKEGLKELKLPVDDDDKLIAWAKETGLVRLQSENNDLLREQIVRAIVTHTDPTSDPPEDLIIALRWPRSRAHELSELLYHLRTSLVKLEDWQPLIAYADAADARGKLVEILARLKKLESLMLYKPEATRVLVLVQQMGIEPLNAEQIEERYREDLINLLRLHDFRGIVQIKQDTRVPLADVYEELGLLELRSEDDRKKAQEQLLRLMQEERMQAEERRIDERVTDAIEKSPRLVILGEPGSGKTMSLKYICLMLAYGYGAARLGLVRPYVPILVRISDYAKALETKPALSLDNFLLAYIQEAFGGSARLGEFLRLYLENGLCVVMLDGLDEVSTDMRTGHGSHAMVVNKVKEFADLWCSEHRRNRIIVTSRIEGYWNDALPNFDHAQLSPLRPPDEIESFLLRWFTAHEKAHNPDLDYANAERKARKRVDDLLPVVLSSSSVRRLATNPLLLTILALIYENVGKLPNKRIELYQIAAQTLIEAWRRMQTGLPDELIAELGQDKIIRIMAPLAYWLHSEHPGGTATQDEWQTKLSNILMDEGFEEEAKDLTNRFLHHARFHSGILAERSHGQFGFFHLTFEEYLAARQIARQRVEERRGMVKLHWRDPRWQEVILLTAGQLGIIESKTGDVSDLLVDILDEEPQTPQDFGRPALLSGRALIDIGPRSVNQNTRRWIEDNLLLTAQDLDPDTRRPNKPPRMPVLTRAAAADALDELGYLPQELYDFIPLNGFTEPIAIGRFPVTNEQYRRFLEDGDFQAERFWTGYPKYAHTEKLIGDWGSAGYQWLRSTHKDPHWSPDGKRLYPRYWHDPRLGISRRGVPVVGLTWYEANAYCKWLAEKWSTLQEGRLNPAPLPVRVRLPLESEWIAAAGGGEPRERYPWDVPGEKPTTQASEIIARANVSESGINRTTPVWMYPDGQSPLHVWDLGGNVWEWQANTYDKDLDVLALRGGSWRYSQHDARLSVRSYDPPADQWSFAGFRVVVVFPK